MSKIYKFLATLALILSVFSVRAQCDIEVTMASGSQGWGDNTTWELQNGNGDVVLSGGTYGNGYNDVQTHTAVIPPYTLVINVNTNTWCDNDGTYLVTVGGVTDLSGDQVSIECGGTLNLPLNTDLSACAPSCLPVGGVAASNIGLTTADLSWTSGAADFNIEWSTAPFTPGNSEEEGSATSATTTYSFTGLSSNTTYFYAVQANCGVDGLSDWSSVQSFTTNPGCGDNVTGLCYSLLNTQEVLVNFTASPGQWAELVFNAGGVETCCDEVIVYDGLNGTGNIIYGALTGGGLADYSGVGSVVSSTGQLSLVVNSDGSVTCNSNGFTPFDVTLNCVAPPACLDPSGLTLDNLTSTSADVSWTAGDTETAWNIEWGAPGFAPGTGAAIDSDVASSESFSITDLTAETNYDVYVQADCGATDGTSEWVGPLNVFTGYCSVSTSNTGDYTSAFSTTAAITNVNYTATSQPAGSYSNQTAQNFQAIPGSSINFSHTYVGGSNGVKIWVDWNNNLQFEASEEVFYLANTDATKTGSIAVPPGTVPGDYRMRVRSQFGGTANPPSCGNVAWGSTIDFQLEIVEVPVSPILSQDPSAPTCDLGTEITAAGSPEADVVWYWQETASGTSTDNEYTGPLTVFANGTYFIRAYHTVYDYWADASSVTVSNFPLVATAPPAPVAGANPVCLPGTEISMPAPDAGFEFYWQTIENGTSTANNADTPWEITATGTYYVATLETATNCWSETSEITVTVETEIPGTPTFTQDQFNFCSSDAEMIVEAELPVLTESLTCQATATAFGVDNTGVTATINDFSCATGEITSAVMNASIFSASGTSWCTDWYAMDIVINGTLIQSGACNQVDFDLTPYLPLSSIQITSVDTDNFGDNMTIDVVVDLEYDSPVDPQPTYTLTWFDDASGENEIGNGLTIDVLGTSVLPTAAAGQYPVYVAATQGVCQGDVVMTMVNVNDVVVTLSPIDVTCNGGNDGSFEVTSILCGAEPFVYSINGGAFDALPTDLTAGVYTIVVQDDNGEESAEMTVTIIQPESVTDVVAETISFEEVELSWNTVGSESQWVIEYGEAGFTIGSGTTVTVDENPAIVSGLNSSTAYDFYIRSLCSEGFEGDNSAVASATTLPSCGDTVYDNGGEDGNYLANSNEVVVICPQNEGDYVQLDFLSFETETTYDGIYVYNGNSTASPLIASENGASAFGPLTQAGAYWGNEIPGPFFSTNEDGCLTVQFLSDGSFQLAGFEYTITCYPVELTPGIDGAQDVCRLDETIDLFDVITAGNDFGTWSFDANPGQLNGSILNIAGLPSGTFTAEYTVINAYDTTVTVATINVFGPSSAGISGNIETCNYGPLNLFDGLSGTVDLGGTWYGPNGNAIAGNTVNFNGQIAAEYEYIYVTSNEICPADTATVLVQLQDCANIAENEIEGFALYPNPTADVINIQYTGVNISTDVILSDAKGAIVYSEKVNFNSDENFTIDMSKLVKGIYFLNIYSEDASKVVRVVKN